MNRMKFYYTVKTLKWFLLERSDSYDDLEDVSIIFRIILILKPCFYYRSKRWWNWSKNEPSSCTSSIVSCSKNMNYLCSFLKLSLSRRKLCLRRQLKRGALAACKYLASSRWIVLGRQPPRTPTVPSNKHLSVAFTRRARADSDQVWDPVVQGWLKWWYPSRWRRWWINIRSISRCSTSCWSLRIRKKTYSTPWAESKT